MLLASGLKEKMNRAEKCLWRLDDIRRGPAASIVQLQII